MPEGKYFKHISCVRQQAWGIDNDDNLWIWGDVGFMPASDEEGTQDIFENRNF